MPTFTPVDHDPFADDAPAPSAPSSAPLISFSDAPSGGGGGPVFVPVDHDPFADDGGARPLTIRGPRNAPAPTMDTLIGGSAATLPAGFSPPRSSAPAPVATADTSAPADDGSLSYDQAFPSPTPHPGGVLSNSQDDGYLSSAAKGAATGAIKGVGDAVGAYGGLSGLADYMIARAESAYTGKPVDQVMAEHAATRQRVQAEMSQDSIGRLANASDPGNVLPAPGDVSGPILSRTGEYVPTSEPGKIAQAGVEAAVGAFGPGGGMISPGTAGKAVVGALARQAPTMAAAGSIGQGVTDFTGDPLLGLGVGLVGAPLAEAGLSKVGSALAPVVGGSKLLNAAPVIGPAIQRARGNEVARTILGQADDPAAVRAAVAQPAPDTAVPNSPQTFAGQIGDQGLYEAEKALRNTKAEKPIDPATGQADQGPTYFNAVDRGASAAQVAALQGIQPTGDVFRPGQAISARIDAINGAADDAIARMTAAHNDAVAGRTSATQAFADGANADLAARQADRTQAGADFAVQQRADLADRTMDRGQASGDAKAAGDALRQAQQDALTQRLSDALAGQQGAAQDAAAPLAGGPLDADGLGGALRSSVEAVRATQKGLHRDLYAQVDPTNSLAMVATPIGDRASAIAADLASRGGELAPAEASLFNRAAALPDVASYSVVHQFDTDISAAMSAERRSAGETPTLARLTQLKGAVKSAMTDAADNHSAWEQRQVAAGAMAPEDTIAARLGSYADEFRSAQQPQARAATGTDDGGYGAARTGSISGVSGATLPQGGRFGASARNPGLSGPRGFDPAPQAQGLSPADLESRTFHQSVPADPTHQVVPINVDRADALWNWTPDYRIGPDAVTGSKLDRAKGFITGLQDGQSFKPPQLGVSDMGLGFDDGRNRFAAMRDLGFKTAPASMDPESIAYARRLGLVDHAPPRPNDPRFSAPPYDPDGLQAPQRPDVPRPQDLRAFVRSRGGMIDTGGDLASMGLHELIGRGARAVDPDRMREAAAEAGYLGGDTARAMRETHPNDLLDALSGDRPVHSVRDEDAAAAWAAHDEARERYGAARGEFGTRSKFGVRQDPAPLSAYSRDDIDGPSGPQVREPAQSGMTPTFDGAAANRLREANAAYAQYARDYKNKIVGPGLRTTGYAGQYASTDASFIKAAIRPGADGYERARAFLTAAKDDPDALAAMHHAVLNPLRRAVTGNGTLPPRELEKWKSADGYGPALRALDSVTPDFSSRFDEAGKATQALLDLGQAHEAQIATAQRDAARQVIVENLQRKDALRQATADDKATVSRLLADRKASDRTEGQADRRDVASSIADRKAADSAATVAGKAERDAGISAAKGIRTAAKATPAAQFAGKVGGAIAPTDVENAVGGMLKTGTAGATRMRSLVQSTASDPDALAGLRKAGVDWIVRNHSNADGTLQPANLIKFLRDNGDTLNELFPHDQRSMFGALARDAEAGMRWRTSTAVKGGSDSAKNLLAALDRGEGGLGKHGVTVAHLAVEGLALGWERLESVGMKGAALAAGGGALAYLANSLRSAGIRNTANLYREAMANPELARALISKMPAEANGGALHNLARVLKRGLIVGPTLTRQAGGSK